jgi:hypothetical protein
VTDQQLDLFRDRETPLEPLLISGTEAASGPYRYSLTRWWGPGEDDDPGYGEVSRKRILWVMLNPSTATATEDDPTIRRCISFSKAWGFPGLTICNLFAWRATNPAGLREVPDPVGGSNDYGVSVHADYAPKIVAAWGAEAARFPEREATVKSILSHSWEKLVVLGLTSGGHPKHPLYVAGVTQPEQWEISA